MVIKTNGALELGLERAAGAVYLALTSMGRVSQGFLTKNALWPPLFTAYLM
jgi:hypothetical protein